MASTRLTIDTKVVSRIQDTALKLGSATAGASAARLDAIDNARAEYERTFPLEKVVQITGTGSFDYLATAVLFPGFIDGRSSFTKIVYPYTATDQELAGLNTDDFGLVRLPAGLYLRFRSAKPSVTEVFLAWYTAQHTLSDTTSTVPEADDDALADLAASYCCEKLAALYAQSADPSVAADAVDYRGKVDYYRSLAKDLRASYERKASLTATAQAGLAIVDLDPPFSAGRRERLLFHD